MRKPNLNAKTNLCYLETDEAPIKRPFNSMAQMWLCIQNIWVK